MLPSIDICHVHWVLRNYSSFMLHALELVEKKCTFTDPIRKIRSVKS